MALLHKNKKKMKMILKFHFMAEYFQELFTKKKFTNIYQKNLFKGKESRSGEGSKTDS